MRTIIFILLILLINELTIAQDKLNELINPENLRRVSFVGEVNKIPIYENNITGDLYRLIENSIDINARYYYELYKKGEREFNENNISRSVQYIFDEYIVYFTAIRSETKPYTYRNEVYLEYPGGKILLAPYQLFDYNLNNKKDFLVFTKDDIDSKHPMYSDGDYIAQKIWYVDLNEEIPKPKQLSIRGTGLKIIGEYLYFYDYYNEVAYDVMFNLYRVKLKDWNNIEMIFRQTYSRGYIYPNHKLLFASIVIDHMPVNIIYNTETQSYARLDENNIYNTGYTVKNTSSTSGASFYSVKFDAAFWKGRTNLNYVSNLPKEYPHKFREIRGVLIDGTNGIHYQGYESFDDLPKKVDLSLPIVEIERLYNFPRPEKPFLNTFITDELMYNATYEELKKLNNSELKLLRNAFFARLGYDFQSKDLQNFFNQFEWYRNSLDRINLENDEIIIPLEDKERIDLILKIEQSKK